MGLLGLTFGATTALMLVIASVAAATDRRNEDARSLALVVAGTWLAARLSDMALGFPATLLLYPVTDAAAGALAFAIWERRPATWKLAVALSFLIQVLAHTCFWLRHDSSPEALWRYVLALNVLFSLQLGAVVAGAFWDALGHGLDRFRRWFRLPALARLSSPDAG